VWPRLLLALLLLSLTSCIPVGDLGSYWARTSLDPQLRGKWKRIAVSPDETIEHGYPIGETSELVEKDGAFELTADRQMGPILDAENKPMWPVKTLTIGRHRWLVLGRAPSWMVEYQFEGGYLDVCPVDLRDLAGFIDKRYPAAPNLEILSGVGVPLRITTFDATAFAVLRDFPGADGCPERTFARFEKPR